MFGMDSDALEKLQDLLSVDVCEIEEDGVTRNYHVNSERAELIRPPTEKPINCFSLAQFLNAVEQAGAAEGDKTIINVLNPFRVEAFRQDVTSACDRHMIAVADFTNVIKRLDSGAQFSQEEFIIKLQSLFLPNSDLGDLLKLVSSVKAERVMESEDDGVSQKIAAKAGVHLVTEIKVKNPWSLQPFMTFPEIEPVDVIYLLRLHQRAEELPKFALYECDGGRWQIKTVERIKAYLQDGVTAKGLAHVKVL